MAKDLKNVVLDFCAEVCKDEKYVSSNERDFDLTRNTYFNTEDTEIPDYTLEAWGGALMVTFNAETPKDSKAWKLVAEILCIPNK